MARKPFKLESFVRRRAGHVMVAYKKKLFLWGGYMEEPHETTYTLMTPSVSHFHDPSEIWIYESLLNIWHRKICTGDVPLQLSGAAAGVIDKFMYLFGGFHSDGPPFEGSTNLFWQLDLETFEWKQLNPNGFQPFPCDKSGSWVYKNRFYVFGGYGQVIPPDSDPPVPVEFQIESGMHYKGWMGQLVYYDTSINEWVWPKAKGTKPKPRAAHAAAVLKNKAYVFGGRHKERRLNDLYCLNLENHDWSEVHCREKGPVPLGRSWHTLNAISEDKLLLYGGFSTECRVLYDIWVFDALAGIWSCLPFSLYPGRLWHCGASIKSAEVIYLGGISSNLLDIKPKLKTESADLDIGLWKEVDLAYDHGEPRCSHCAVTLPEGQVWIVSGLTQPYYITVHLLIDHAEDMLRIRFSPPSLFELVLEYVSNSQLVPKRSWSQLTPLIQKILQVRTDPFEIHGL